MKGKKINIAIVGATGAVGAQMITSVEESSLNIESVILLASAKSKGRKLRFKGDILEVEELTKDSFKNIDIALFSAGASVSEKFAPIAASSGAVVVDNSSAWRMDPDVPLVVPEVNPHAIADCSKKGIIANPNCSTIQMVVVLKPIYDRFGIKRIVVSTYQAVSGTGKKAINELFDQTRAMLNFLDYETKVYPHRIAFNCLPHIDKFLENGYTKEEMKMVNETRKILEDNSIGVTATTVRVPVFFGHSEAVNIETHKALTVKEVRKILEDAPGVKVQDEPAKNIYPLAIDAAGKDTTLVGRIRIDESVENGLNLWVVADNIRKGAATNAVQIAEIVANN